jgi:predicted nucleic acid-binding protein
MPSPKGGKLKPKPDVETVPSEQGEGQEAPHGERTYFLDTNVIVYALGRSEDGPPEIRALEEAARAVVRAIGAERIEAVTGLVVLYELIYLLARWARRGRGPRMPEARRVVADVVALCREVYTPTLAELSRALEGYDPGKHDFNDRLIAEAMRAHGVRHILTADRGFAGMEEIEPVSPEELAGRLSQEE